MKRKPVLKKLGWLLLAVIFTFSIAGLSACSIGNSPSDEGKSTTITFMVDGEVYETVTVKDSSGKMPADPQKNGYAFKGWYEDESFTLKFDFTAYIQSADRENITVYAYFEPNADAQRRTITFDVNGGDAQIEPREYVVGELLDLPVPVRSGYRFVGWKDAAGTLYDNTDVMPDEDLTLYAEWEKEVGTYSDEYVTFKPATEGKKQDDTYYSGFEGVQEYLYVELTSDDLGGVANVGQPNNYDLSQNEQMDYTVKSGYTLAWYEGSWNVPNGAQLFTLDYGSNIQLLTVSEGQRVVKRYLVDIYILHDYYVNLYTNVYADEPYDTMRVVENKKVPSDTQVYEIEGFEFEERVYFNEETDSFVPFDYDTMIRSDWDLYQTYSEKEIALELGGGNLDEDSFAVKPYSKGQTLPVPVKENYDFIGWKLEDGRFFSDITGYNSELLLSEENDFTSLTAVWEPKRYYPLYEENTVTFLETVPVATYTDQSQTVLNEVIYVPKGTDCMLPVKIASAGTDKIFIGWKQYDHKTGETHAADFDFAVTEPAALFADMESVGGNGSHKAVLLNGELVYSANADDIFRAYLPTGGEYTLTVETTGRVSFTVNAYGDVSAASYTAESGAPAVVRLQYNDIESGYVSFTVKECSGTMTVKLDGATAATAGEPMPAPKEYAVYGEETTISLTGKLGYGIVGWYDGAGEKVSDSAEYTFLFDGTGLSFTGKYDVLPEMQNFVFESTKTECVITGVKDSSVKEIVIPDYVTGVQAGAFAGCGALETLQAPFAGTSPETQGLSAMFGDKVPASLRSLTITGSTPLEEGALAGADGLSSLTVYTMGGSTLSELFGRAIPAGLEEVAVLHGGSLPAGAFKDCISLKTCILPAEMTQIGNESFYGCEALEEIDLSKVEEIGTSAFRGCTMLKNADLSSATAVGDHAFRSSGLMCAEFGAPVERIGQYAFSYCGDMTEIYLPAEIKNIGSKAFASCGGLTIYCKAEGVGNNWSYDWNSSNCPVVWNSDENKVAEDGYTYAMIDGLRYALKESVASVSAQPDRVSGNISIPETVVFEGNAYTVTSVGNNAFYFSGAIESVVIADTVVSIGDFAFKGQSTLVCVEIGNGVQSIGESAFQNCSGLTDLALGTGLQTIAESAFSGCSALTMIDYAGTSGEWGAIEGLQYLMNKGRGLRIGGAELSGKLEISDGVERIAAYAFAYQDKLTEIVVPDSVKEIGAAAFLGCDGLQKITVPFVGASADGDTSKYFEWIFSAVYQISSSGKYIPATLTEVVVTGGLWTGTFINCKNLTSITFLSDIIEITAFSFQDCASLSEVVINSTVESIGEEAFYNCKNLGSLTLGAALRTVGTNAFYGDSNLSVNYLGSGADWLRIDDPGEITGRAKEILFNGAPLAGELVVPEDIAAIPDKAFFGFAGLTKVVLSAAIGEIGDSAFEGCAALEEVVFPEGLTKIGSKAFCGCAALTEIIVPDGVTEIGISAFEGCTALESVTLPIVGGGKMSNDSHFGYIFGAASAEENADHVPASIRNVVITMEETLSSQGAFYGCANITSLTLPASLRDIPAGTLRGCSSLESLTIPYLGSSLKRVDASDARYPFGYIFSTKEYEGSVAVEQEYMASSFYMEQTTTYYIPQTLREVIVLGGDMVQGAFMNCTMIERIEFYGAETIATNALYGCTSLKSLTIGEGAFAVETSAIRSGTELSEINYKGSMADWLNSTGHVSLLCNPLDLTIGGTLLSGSLAITANKVPDYAFAYQTAITELTVNGASTIGEKAFFGCSGLKKVLIDESANYIEKGAFAGCSSLEELIVPFVGYYNGETYTVARYPLGYIFGSEEYEGGTEVLQRYAGENSYNTATVRDTYYIPSSLRKVTVTNGEVYPGSFYGCDMLTSVTVGREVTLIQEYAFYNCSSLISVELPETVQYIKQYAFAGCSAIEEIALPGAETIEQYAFSECAALSEISLPACTGIARNAFENCTSLVSASLPLCETLGEYAFSGCTSLADVSFDRLNAVGDYAFSGCTSLRNVDLGEKLAEIEAYAFSGCTSLESIELPVSLNTVGEYAFNNCSALSNVVLNEGLKTIEQYAFAGCAALENIAVPAGIELIGMGVFSGCSGLKEISLPFVGEKYNGGADASMTRYPFGYIFGGIEYEGGVEVEQYYYADSGYTRNNVYYIPQGLSKVTIKGGYLDYGAFSGCSMLEEITLGTGVTGIQEKAFESVKNLQTVKYEGGFAEWFGLEYGGYEYILSAGRLLCVGGVELRGSVEIPEGATDIPSYALANQTDITELVLPNSLETIGEGAFSGCSGITAITVPFVGDTRHKATDGNQYPFGYIFGVTEYEGSTGVQQTYQGVGSAKPSATYYLPQALTSVTVTDGDIPYGAFMNCSGITSVALGSGVTAIANSAFESSGLESIAFGSAMKSIGTSLVFYRCDALAKINYEGSLTEWNQIEGLKQLMAEGRVLYIDGKELMGYITLPEGWESVADFAFAYQNKIISVNIPSSVKAIGDGAFRSNETLNNVTIGGAESIGEYAFADCPALQEIDLGGVKTIGDYAFNKCAWLKKVEMPNVEEIGSYAFGECTVLSEIEFPSILARIGGYAFYECRSITSIVIPISVTEIDSKAFYVCYALTIYCEAPSKPSGWASDWNYSSPVIWDCNASDADEDGNIYAVVDGLRYRLNAGNAFLTRQPQSLTGNIVIPESVSYGGNTYAVKGIDEQAFSECVNLYGITLPSGMTTIGYRAFKSCAQLRSVALSDTITEIESSAFLECGMLTDVTFAESGSFMSISGAAFSDCCNLREITIPKYVTAIGASAFEGCDLLTIYCEVPTRPSDYVEDSRGDWNKGDNPVIWDCKNNLKDEQGYVYAEVGGIRYRFDEDTLEASVAVQLESFAGELDIPQSVQYGGKDYTVVAVDDFVFCTDINGSELNGLLTNVMLPDTLRRIGERAFYGQSLFDTIRLPAGIELVGSMAFYGCSGLVNLVFAGGGNGTTLSYQAFAYCTKLTGLTLNGVTVIGGSAFFECSSLRFVNCLDAETLGRDAFRACNDLSGIRLGAGLTSVESPFYSGNVLEKVYYDGTPAQWASLSGAGDIMTEGVVLYINNIELTGILDLTGVETINSYAFWNQNKITAVIVSQELTAVNNGAFSGCSALERIYFTGSEEEWQDGYVGSGNKYYSAAERYYFSADNPFEGSGAVTSGNYWHYSSDGKTPEIWVKQ